MESSADGARETIGWLLKDARSEKGLTIETAAAGSKVSLFFVRLMEEEQFHLLPDPSYIMRFLREYSVFLGLDPKQVETQFRRQVTRAKAMAPLHAMASVGSKIQLRRRLLLYLLPAVAAVPLIFLVLSLFSGRPPERQSSRDPLSPAPQEATPQLPHVGAVTPPGLQSGTSRYTLKAEAKETSWLEVSADGSARREVKLRPGESAEWSANEGFVVTIGNSRGIALSLNGRPVSLKGGRGQVIRDLSLPMDGEAAKRR